MIQSDLTEQGASEQALKQLKVERDRLKAQLETMYLDRLDGRITASFRDEKSAEWRRQLQQIAARIAQLATIEPQTGRGGRAHPSVGERRREGL